MKKTLAFLLILTSFLWMFGCSEQTEPPTNADESAPKQESPDTDHDSYQVQTISASDSALLSSAIEFPLWQSSFFQDENAPLEMEVVFENVTYKGTYEKSWVRKYDYYPVHIYNVADPYLSFSVDSDGRLLKFHRYYLESDLSKPQLTQEQCEQIAFDFLSTKVEHPEDYTMTSRAVPSWTYYVGYDVDFVKYIDSKETMDQFHFTVEGTTGQIKYFNSYMPNQIDAEAEFPFDQETMDQAVTARLDELFADTNFDTVEYQEFEYILTKISATEYAVVCKARLGCYKDGACFHQLLEFVVTE